jgi:cyclophilin family peptidyl-prolyl cis-trans isomerase
MSKRKTRDRQLAKLAARRAAERRHKRRQRIVAGVVAFAVAIGGGAFAFAAFTGGKEKPKPSASGSPTPSPSASYSPGTGKQTGTVKPQPVPDKVACGAKAPPEAGKPKPQFDGPPPVTIDTTATYVATMKTSCGTIKIKLLPDNAPLTVNSFVFLAKHRFFDGQYFIRLDTSIDVVQGGSPQGPGPGGPGYTIPDELTGAETYPPGTLAMAHGAAANSGGSQFFIITGPNGHGLDTPPGNTYTVFGKVVAGLDVAKRIQALPIKDPSAGAQGDLTAQAPKQAVYIDALTVAVQKAKATPAPTKTKSKASPSPPK